VSETTCPICGEIATVPELPVTSKTRISCERCGCFSVTWTYAMTPAAIPIDTRPYLSAATRQAFERGLELTLNTENWKDLAENQRAVRVPERLDRLLRLIADGSGQPGKFRVITPAIDYPLISARDSVELEAYLNYFVGKDILRIRAAGPGKNGYELTIDGWNSIEPSISPGGTPGRCFVAMSFDKALDDAYTLGLKLAIQDCGFKPICMREVQTNTGITDRILSEIRRAQFMVADFTGQNQGVYFEAGFARGLGREVIWTCRTDELAQLHFDTKQLGHVLWDTPENLRMRLTDSIRANIIPKT